MHGKLRPRKGNSMSPENDAGQEDEMRPEYDLRGGVRGKYYKQYMEESNVVLLDPDVAAVFHDSASVNQALRVLINAARQVGASGEGRGDESPGPGGVR
jgi:hypothetical protein